MRDERFKKITVAENQFEADLITQTLADEGIPCLVRSYHDTAYDGLFITQKGWAAVMVPEDSAQQADAIITELRQSIKPPQEDGEPDKGFPT
jgi:hypothetical protein